MRPCSSSAPPLTFGGVSSNVRFQFVGKRTGLFVPLAEKRLKVSSATGSTLARTSVPSSAKSASSVSR
ncbi:MAG: hypothetical protein ACYTE6_12490 [Planctomycetota bacterium]